MNLFEKFETGKLLLPSNQINFESVSWSPHAKFEGVALKHLITSKDTNGVFSYHLVRIAPNMKIGIELYNFKIFRVIIGCISHKSHLPF